MACILKRDIHWADLDARRSREQAGLHPVLIVSQEPRASFPHTLELRNSKLPKKVWVKISQIRTLSTERPTSKLGKADAQEREAVIKGLNEIIGA